jgi:hypothetical protein
MPNKFYEIDSRALCIKTFYICSLSMSMISIMFEPGNLFQPSLMFLSKVGAYPSEALFSLSMSMISIMFLPGKLFQPSLIFVSKVGAYTSKALFSLLANFGLGWKGLTRTRTQSYYKHL